MSDKDICRAPFMARNKLIYRAINGGIRGCQQWHQPPLGTGDSTIVPCPPPSLPARLGLPIVGTGWAGRPFDPGQSFPGQIKALPLQLFIIPSSSPCLNLLSLGVGTSRSCQRGRLKIRFSSTLTQNTQNQAGRMEQDLGLGCSELLWPCQGIVWVGKGVRGWKLCGRSSLCF